MLELTNPNKTLVSLVITISYWSIILYSWLLRN